ncbi:HNS-dependent expression A [Methylocystis sp. WRRC1]|uniref:acid-activated periplasmic chaperone HdeA n=1 Tax=Methylocystis sp. WRRC1 TaxID=1732014 RepID=UPI001D1559B0|nr:acid-activated periplasmic chaperone HdeA [Methylocystis sp. WRRC1]MCC3246056.1 HNS-dependent expression A [Methylocystis sp. WRRC1]
MKLRYFAFVACLLAAQGAVADNKKPVSKWTCEEFLAVESDFQPKVVYFATAKAKAGKADSIVDIEGTEKVVPMIIDDCKKAPGESFLAKLKNAWRSVEAEAKKVKDKM